MPEKKPKRIYRKLSDEDRARHDEIRVQVKKEFPPAEKKRQPVRKGVAADLRRARKSQQLTYYAVAKQAGIPNPNTVKDVEYGRDAKLSSIEAIAKVLGLKLELVESNLHWNPQFFSTPSPPSPIRCRLR